MPKGNQQKRINRSLDDEQGRIDREHGDLNRELYNQVPRARERQETAYNEAFKGYQGFLNDEDGGSGGGYDPGFGKYEDLYRKLYDTGGIDDEMKHRIRGKGVFDEYAKTGGYSEGDKANIRARGTATIPSFFAALKARMDQMNAVSGGSPSYSSSLSRLSRDQSRQSADAALNADLGIMDRVNEGRKWGASSLSGAELGLGDLTSRNKLAGLEGALRAAGMGADFNLNREGLTSRNKLAALEGLRGLRTDEPGEEFGLYDRIIKSIGQRGGLAGGNLDRRMAYNPNKSGFDKFKDIMGIAAPLAMTIFGGPAAGAMGAGRLFGGGTKKLPKGRNYQNLSQYVPG